MKYISVFAHVSTAVQLYVRQYVPVPLHSKCQKYVQSILNLVLSASAAAPSLAPRTFDILINICLSHTKFTNSRPRYLINIDEA